MKKIYIILSLVLAGLMFSCDSMFDVKNREILDDKEVFSNADGVRSVLATIYSRIRDTQEFNHDVMNDWDESISGEGTDGSSNYGQGYRTYWDYNLVREVNLFLENLEKYGDPILPAEREYFEAEGRFLRVWIYFDLVKNMGGVPLITESFDYVVGSDPSEYEVARSTEVAIYQFIEDELDDIKEALDVRVGNTAVKNRATKGAALALKCRAMLYAGSIAKYTPLSGLELTLPGGEVGIPAASANAYYQKALDAFKELELMGIYKLYDNSSDKVQNFYEALTQKYTNPESIFIKDYDATNIKNWFTTHAIPRSMREDVGKGARVNPTLNLVEDFQLLDGTFAKLKTKNAGESVENVNVNNVGNDYVIYDNLSDIFAGRDPRLEGTVILPGAKFKGAEVSIYAGLAIWNNNGYDLKHVEKIEDLLGANEEKKLHDGRYITGFDGPHMNSDQVTRTGFLLRKYLDDKGGAEAMGRSDMAFVRLRYGEALLNAAEAAFELGLNGEALGYINRIRNRAGGDAFELTSLTAIDQVRYERRAELAFEDHRFNDLRRWRIGDKVFDGNTNTPTSVVYALWPYQIYRPGHATDKKYIFRRVVAPKKLNSLQFLRANYYGAISSEVLSNNKLLVKNPYQD